MNFAEIKEPITDPSSDEPQKKNVFCIFARNYLTIFALFIFFPIYIHLFRVYFLLFQMERNWSAKSKRFANLWVQHCIPWMTRLTKGDQTLWK
jgi:hypothetical protein